RRAQGGMPGERQLFLHREDAHAHALARLRPAIAGQDKGGFGQVHLARELLHLAVGEPAPVGEYRQRVSLQLARGENVELHERILALCHSLLLQRAVWTRAARRAIETFSCQVAARHRPGLARIFAAGWAAPASGNQRPAVLTVQAPAAYPNRIISDQRRALSMLARIQPRWS